MKTFKTFSQVEESFKQETIKESVAIAQSKILESFAELLVQYNITESHQITGELFESFINKLNEKKNFIELDTPDPDNEPLQKFLNKYKIKTEVVMEDGPSTYPVIRYIGEEKDLEEMYLKFWDKKGIDDFYDFLGTYYQ